jgi:hypothetical protein
MPNSNSNLSDALTTGQWNTTQQIQENQTVTPETYSPAWYKAQENETEPRTFLTCYTSFSSFVFLSNAFMPFTVDMTDPDIKQLFSNLCDYFHERTGRWINAFELSSINTSLKPDPEGFKSKYYPNGFPASVQKLIQDSSILNRK